MSVGENIKYLRKKAHLTQKQLSELTGIHETSIRGFEANKYKPRSESLYKLRDALQCDLNEILDHPYDLSDASSDEWEEIAPGITIPTNCPNEIKDILKKQLGNSSASEGEKTSYEDILNKIDKGIPLTDFELNFLCTTCVNRYYDELNTSGKANANSYIKDLLHELELLTKVPDYKKQS